MAIYETAAYYPTICDHKSRGIGCVPTAYETSAAVYMSDETTSKISYVQLCFHLSS